MQKQFEFNGKTYKIPTIDFNAMCELGVRGLNLEAVIPRKTFITLKLIRALISFVINESPEETGKLIEKEMINDVQGFYKKIEPLVEAFKDSDFFKNLAK